MKIISVLLLCLVVIGWPLRLSCRVGDEWGYKFFKRYHSGDYVNDSRNFQIVQDKRGLIYVANMGGLLKFDGVSWKSIDIPNQFGFPNSMVKSLAVDEDNVLYVGGLMNFGYLTPGKSGELHYKSLTGHLTEEQKLFGIVERIHATKEGIFFQSHDFLFRWDGRKIKSWQPGAKRIFATSFVVKDSLYANHLGSGLSIIEKDSMTPLLGCNLIKKSRILVVASFDDNKLLIGTRRGLFLHDGTRLAPFPTEVDDLLKLGLLTCGIRLSNGDFALGTAMGGVIVIDRTGKRKTILDKSKYLLDRGINHVFEDRQGNLWLALERGISKIEYNSPFSFFDEKLGLTRSVLFLKRHQEKLYIGTHDGLFFMTTDGRFEEALNIESTCWSLLSFENFFLLATSQGLLQVAPGMRREILPGFTHGLKQSRFEPRRVWVKNHKGLATIFYKNGRWQEERDLAWSLGSIRSVFEDRKDRLWVGFRFSVLKVDFPLLGSIKKPIISQYNRHDSPPFKETRVFEAAGHVVFATSDGLFRFDEEKNRFVPDTTMGPEFNDGSNNVLCLVEDRGKNIWLHSNMRNIQAIPRGSGTYKLVKKPFLRLPMVQTRIIYPDPDGDVVWFVTGDGLIRYDRRVKKDYDLEPEVLIRSLKAKDEVIYGGHGAFPDVPKIPFKNQKIRFEYAAPFFEGEEETRYQTFLEGHDQGWGEWSKETEKYFATLDAGLYTFRVKAKNVYETVGKEVSFQFRILSPWYWQWWAILTYLLLLTLLAYLISSWWRGRSLEREKVRLEGIVTARTREIGEKNRQLEEQTVQLQEQSGKLLELDRVKSRFFANISHEFRTPLTLITGPLEEMISGCGDREEEKKRKLTLMLRNAQRLLRLINQLLELSRLDSGKMKLRAVQTGVIGFVKGIVESFRVLAGQRELELLFETDREEGDILLHIDPRKLEDILSNLLVNAMKFTPPGGRVMVKMREHPERDDTFPRGCLEIGVTDTGPGIPGDQLAHIFERFYQADSVFENRQKGSGIGLALANELVELHYGTLSARSKEGEGSTFIVRLPLGEDHLAPEEKAGTGNGEDYESCVPAMLVDTDNHPTREEPVETGITVPDKEIVLVVEDNADMRGYIKGTLTPDFTVIEAEDGKQGIEKALETVPDLVVSDIMMPGVDGYELCRTLKGDIRTSHVPLILLTAKASEQSMVEGLETGADDYVTKPFNTRILLARIKNLIDLRRQLQKNVHREMTLQPAGTGLSKLDHEFLQDLHAQIEENLGKEDFNVEQLRQKLYMGRTTLYRKILALTGERPTEFIRSFRLKRAAELLKQQGKTVLETALDVGFANSSYFAKCFKEKFHQLPSDFQSSHQ